MSRSMLARSALALVSIVSSSLAQVTTLDSRSSTGAQGNAISDVGALSAGGHFIAYQSKATNLVGGDTNGQQDVFLTDRTTGQTVLVSRASTGAIGNAASWSPSVTANGRYVAFDSLASNLTGQDGNGTYDVFVRDLVTSQTRCISVGQAGEAGNGESRISWGRGISADGAVVAFQSHASNLVGGDFEGKLDVFVWDSQTQATARISRSIGGGGANANSGNPSISIGGRWVVFESTATDIVPGATGVHSNIYRFDRELGAYLMVSRDAAGQEWNNGSYWPSVSADGRFTAFVSNATDVVSGDNNGSGDVFIFDAMTLQTTLASRSGSGGVPNGTSIVPSVSWDGSFVCYQSDANNIIAGLSWWKVYLWERNLGVTTGMSRGIGGWASGGTYFPSMTQDGKMVSFHSLDSSLVVGDNNSNHDVFTRQWLSCSPLVAIYADNDGDGFGGAYLGTGCPPMAGTSLIPGDCDDNNIYIHPGALEVSDGLDNDCDGVIDAGGIYTYCTAGTTVSGCVPSISGQGAPSSSSPSGFDIVVDNVPAQRMGLIFYGQNAIPQPQPWGVGSASYICIYYPVARTGAHNSGGTAGTCNGQLRVDFNAFMAANPLALGSPFHFGQVLHAQGWFRDPGAAKQTNLSNALTFTLRN